MEDKIKTTEVKETVKKSPGRPKSTQKKVEAAKVVETPKVIEKVVEVPKKKREMDELIMVKSLVANGSLSYLSKAQQGYRVDWDGYLEEQYIEYKELINMRGSQRKFFEKPWIICDWDVLVDLKVDKYYKDLIDLEKIDELFEKDVEEFKKILELSPSGIRTIILDKASIKRKEGSLDSLGIIKAIKDVLDVDLSI